MSAAATSGPAAARLESFERRLVLATLLALLVAPLTVARYPPVLDLAQQSAQVRLFAEAIADPGGPYRIQWAAPNKLSYPVLALGVALGGAEWGPRLGLLGCSVLFVAGTFLLAARLGRPREHALLAAVFVFSAAYYGGFLNFLVGAAAGAWWLVVQAEAGAPPARRAWLRLAIAALLLYLGHVLWLAVAGYLAVTVGSRRGWRRPALLGISALAPFVTAAALWYASLGDARWGQWLRYDTTPWQRLAQVEYWSTWTLGGLKGPWEAVLQVAIVTWAAVCLRPSNPRRTDWDPWLARVAAALALLALVLPDAVGDTALLNRRWAPWTAVVALLALPPAGLRRRWSVGVPLLLVLSHTVVTTVAWNGFDRDEMVGFEESLAAVPAGSRLLELDFDRHSPRFWIDPFFHMAAHAQLDRRVTLGYSFAGTPSSLVVFRRADWPWPWTRGLEHRPGRLRPGDLDHFDHVLLHATEPARSAIVLRIQRLEEIAGQGGWRLYRVNAADEGGHPGPLSRRHNRPRDPIPFSKSLLYGPEFMPGPVAASALLPVNRSRQVGSRFGMGTVTVRVRPDTRCSPIDFRR